MTKYYWNTIEVFPLTGQQFSTHWNCYRNLPTEDGGNRRIIISIPSEQIATDAPTEKEASNIDSTLNINQATYTTIREVLGVGIGRVTPKAFISNRPADGYKDIEDMKSLNKNLNNINWEEIEKKIAF